MSTGPNTATRPPSPVRVASGFPADPKALGLPEILCCSYCDAMATHLDMHKDWFQGAYGDHEKEWMAPTSCAQGKLLPLGGEVCSPETVDGGWTAAVEGPSW